MTPTRKPDFRDAREFGANIAARRRKLELSQSELAEMVGMTQVSLSRIESGQATPKFKRLSAFARALQCSVADLFTNITDTEKDKGALFAEIIHPLPPLWQDAILKSAMQMARTAGTSLEESADSVRGTDRAAREDA